MADVNKEAEDNALIKTDSKKTKKEARRIRSEIVTRRSMVMKPLENEIKDIEMRIMTLEADLDDYNRLMQDASQQGDGTRIQSLSQDIYRVRSLIDELFDKLEVSVNERDKKRLQFEREIADLGLE